MAGSLAWQSGLCGCCDDCGICCQTMYFPCCTYGQNVRDATGTEGCCCPACNYMLCSMIGCMWLLSYPNRRTIRQKYNLKEEPCGDCCVHFWCHPLALCQEARELKMRRAMGVVPPPQVPTSYQPPAQV